MAERSLLIKGLTTLPRSNKESKSPGRVFFLRGGVLEKSCFFFVCCFFYASQM